jgi:type VI protein secretion system component VasK
MLTRLFRPHVVLPTAALSATGVIGFFGGSLGILSWDTVVFILVTVVALVAVFLLAWWILRRQQARGLSDELMRRQERNLASANPERKANLQPITEEFRRNIDFLRKMKKKNGIPAIYYLPWYMIIGAPASGKSVLLKGSGFRFCVNDTPLKEGGTLHCDWWFTNQGIFLDTAGRLTVHEGGAADRTEWEALLRLLRRFRGKRPVDGIIVTVGANFLLEKTEREIQAYARQVRERIDRSTEFLRIRMPVFVAVTKCDLVDGFKEFFDALPEAALSQILGWTNETMAFEGTEQVEEAFRGIADRCRDLRPMVLETEGSREKRRQMYPFPEEFENLGEPLLSFVEGLFREDMYTRSPALAGLYFTSGTQEGTTVSRYFRRVGEQLGLPAEALGRTFGEQEERRPYFVRDLFWRVIAPSTGLVVPVDSEKDARRRMLLGVATAAGALLLGVLSTISYARNAGFVRTYPDRLREKLEATSEIDAEQPARSLQDSLAAFGVAADAVAELDRHPFLDNWGLNKRGRLRADARELFRDHFEKKLWSSFAPLMTSGLEGDARLNLSCAERTNLLLGYLGLVGAEPGEAPPVQAARRLLEVFFQNSEPADQENLAKAWAIFGEVRSGGGAIDLSTPARVVAEACAEEANPVEALQKIQNDCWPSPGESCFPRLAAIASVSREVLDSRRKSFEELAGQLGRKQVDDETRQRLKDVLEELKRAGGKGKGGGLLSRIGVGTAQAGEPAGPGCAETYFKTVAPDVQELVKQGNLYRASMAKQAQLGAAGQPKVVEAAATGALGDVEQSLRSGVELLNAACDGAEIRSAALVQIARGHILGTAAGRGGGRVTAPGYTRSAWEASCGRLGGAKKDLVLGEARPEVQARGVAAIERQARSYSDSFEQYWRRELARPDPSSTATAEGLTGAADALKESLAKVSAEVDGLQCPTIPSLERGPRKIADIVGGLSQGLAAYEQGAQKAADWIEEQVKAGKRSEVVDRTMRGEGPVAELCAYIDSLGQPDLAQVLRSPVVRQWNNSVLGGLAANLRTSWQQRILGISELTRRYPFKTSGDTHASLVVARDWLDPKAGRLIQLYYQMAPQSSEGAQGPPCDLRVKSNIGPGTTVLLRRAKSASDLIFRDQEGEKPVQKLRFTFSGVEFEEKDAEERYGVKMTQIVMVLAGQRLTYIMDQPAPRELVVPLPSAAPVNSYVEVSVVGGKRRADVRPARLERGGEWSPLALLRLAEREPAQGGGVRLTWKVPYGSGPPYILLSFDGDERVKTLIETDFELEATDSPDR